MGNAKRWCNRPHFLLRVEQRFEPAIAIGVQNAGEGGQILLRMLASPVARSVLDCRRRRRHGGRPSRTQLQSPPVVHLRVAGIRMVW